MGRKDDGDDNDDDDDDADADDEIIRKHFKRINPSSLASQWPQQQQTYLASGTIALWRCVKKIVANKQK